VYEDTETLQWYVDDNVYATTTCESGADIILPNTPTKYGYTFQGWGVYTPIEYLESTGTQYIDTGIVPALNTGIKIIFNSSNTTTNNPLYGSRKAYKNQSFDTWIYGATGCRIDIGDTENYIGILVPNTTYELQIIDSMIILDKRHIGTYTPIEYSEYCIYIFNINNANQAMQASGYTVKIYEVIIYEGSNILQHFIPVLDANGVACMYDKVEKKFYYNAGTGDFIAGPVIND
jgi:hypothetical protein